MPAAAFFDLDRTLISGASGYHWSVAAANAGLIGRRMLVEHAYRNLRFRISGSTDAATDRVMSQLAATIEGKEALAFQSLGPEVVGRVMARVYPQVVDLAREHQRNGRPAFIATAATQHTVDLIAAELGFDGAIGTELEERDGIYTGTVAHFAYREGKAHAIRRFAAEREIDLAASYAYSDSESDLPMLRCVGIPVAVNPDRALARVALEEGWEILRFRRPRRARRRRSTPTTPR